MRVVLVPVSNRPESKQSLSVAFDLGARLGASVKGCHMRPHRYDDTRFAPSTGETEWKRRSSTSSRAKAKSLFLEMADSAGFPMRKKASVEPAAYWDEKVGSPVKLMGIVGPLADLIVVNRPARSGSIADLFLGSALHESGRPVLVLPRKARKKIGSRICIGWNQTEGAASTVAAVTPLLASAESVTIVCCGPEDRAGPKSRQLVQYLGHYGIKAECVRTRGLDIEAELEDACEDAGADLLVAGAYSKNRWRERIFGGTTEWLIRKSRLPVLLQHG
jgi:nucleotide-binding universal stress UspA family protein